MRCNSSYVEHLLKDGDRSKLVAIVPGVGGSDLDAQPLLPNQYEPDEGSSTCSRECPKNTFIQHPNN